MSSREALKLAEDAGVDLVKIAPTAKPPVCKIVDYGKFNMNRPEKKRKPRKNRKRLRLKRSVCPRTLIPTI